MAKQNFYLTIINHILKTNSLPKLSISKQARNYYIRQLKIDGIINRVGYGTWEVNEAKAERYKQVKITSKATPKPIYKDSHSKVFTSKDKRGHGYIITFHIPHIEKWKERRGFLQKKGLTPYNVGIRDSGQGIEYKGHKIHLYNRSIVIYTPAHLSYYSETAKGSWQYAIYDLTRLMISLENLFNIKLRKKHFSFSIGRQHYGKINDILAKQIQKGGKRLEIKQNGKTWLITDRSLNVDELETVDKDRSPLDMDQVIAPFLNDLRDHYQNTGESIKISEMIKLHHMYAENITAHVESIKKLSSIIERIERRLK